jgi:hypothetical protein
MSSSPWEWLCNGDEDVATPFLTGAVSRRPLPGYVCFASCVEGRRRLSLAFGHFAH